MMSVGCREGFKTAFDPLRTSVSPANIKRAHRSHTLCCPHRHRLRGGALSPLMGVHEAVTVGRLQRQKSRPSAATSHRAPDRVQRSGRVRLHISDARDCMFGCAPRQRPCDDLFPDMGSGWLCNLGGVRQKVLRAQQASPGCPLSTHRRPRQPPLAAGLILGARSRLRPMTAPHLPNGRAQDSRSFQSALSAPAFGDSRPRKRAARPHPSDSDAAPCSNDVMKEADGSSRAKRAVGARNPMAS